MGGTRSASAADPTSPTTDDLSAAHRTLAEPLADASGPAGATPSEVMTSPCKQTDDLDDLDDLLKRVEELRQSIGTIDDNVEGNAGASAHEVIVWPPHVPADAPMRDDFLWQAETTAFASVLQATCFVIAAMTGNSIAEAQLIDDAASNDLFLDGLSPWDLAELLNKHDTPSHAVVPGDIACLMAELTLGHRVIVGFAHGAFSERAPSLDDVFEHAAARAIWATGVDQSDPGNPKVIIADSRDPASTGVVYELHRFLGVWRTSGFFYVATNHAPDNCADACRDFEAGIFPALDVYFGKHTRGFDDRLIHLSGTPALLEAGGVVDPCWIDDWLESK